MEKTGGKLNIDAIFPNATSLSAPDFSVLNEDESLIAKTIDMFVQDDVLPNNAKLEAHDYETARDLFQEAGDLGLLGVEVPESYGGLEMGKKASGLVAEKMGYAASFSVAFNIHSGVGTLPYVYFGTEDQKHRYLPKLVTGEWVGAYALTEPNAGSDALAARTTAKLDEATGEWVINGEKQWITNAHIADVYVVFAKTDMGITAFIVERKMPGVSVGAEEKKLGIKGSSTATLIMEDVYVPPENVLGTVGKGHHIALNILNLARLKLAFANVGASKQALSVAVKYAKDREQFGKSLVQFPMIQEKLANIAVAIYGAESAAYYTASVLDGLGESGKADDVIHSLANYAMDCSVNKVFASETLDYAVDEALQIHGGYGYMQDYVAERLYRDARINRIFEGTNEINRLTIAKAFLKHMNDETEGEALVSSEASTQSDIAADRNWQFIFAAEKLLQITMKSLPIKNRKDMDEKQEFMQRLADVVKDIYVMKAAVLASSHKTAGALKQRMTDVLCEEGYQRIAQAATTVVAAAYADAAEKQAALDDIRSLAVPLYSDLFSAKRQIAETIISQAGYEK
ncbi:acyl-CoA dehydrogenase family protein [Virgibacillus sp. 179-BFC.A HS]|uniref:Acyl-CoA dehydrogenase family protein n=1 Tax=Tigheibacillus jepli TaxID=3035914 RepID=A0ABU5CMW6_9BACI|nr:acyl-CoA dehydrogenase family protein [Virgibacillus sp. 179-BFC.A HS]MDY0407144.1 acyl-CoA dehydrogenase family protein [Virgibacillus sp. 179-BFC.A HS]